MEWQVQDLPLHVNQMKGGSNVVDNSSSGSDPSSAWHFALRAGFQS